MIDGFEATAKDIAVKIGSKTGIHEGDNTEKLYNYINSLDESQADKLIQLRNIALLLSNNNIDSNTTKRILEPLAISKTFTDNEFSKILENILTEFSRYSKTKSDYMTIIKKTAADKRDFVLIPKSSDTKEFVLIPTKEIRNLVISKPKDIVNKIEFQQKIMDAILNGKIKKEYIERLFSKKDFDDAIKNNEDADDNDFEDLLIDDYLLSDNDEEIQEAQENTKAKELNANIDEVFDNDTENVDIDTDTNQQFNDEDEEENNADLNEELSSSSAHPLIKLLDIIDNHEDENSFKEDIDVVEDNDGDETTFNGKNIKVGDASSVTYKKDNIKNIVTANSEQNNMTFSHKKGSPVFAPLVADTIFATVKYMTEKGQIPFTMNINGKSKEYIDAVMSTLFGFSEAVTNTIQDPAKKEAHLHYLDNVTAFKIGDITLSTSELKS
ncbi:MAG: hypothetical protein IJ638_00780, partial [Alphaproteobacteria bacterium]|nr:hypothetical protein [Alphaproteobacteria bacterium]